MCAFQRNLLLALLGISAILTQANAASLNSTKPSVRIVGGLPANDINIPYVVSLVTYGYHFCGGAIINSRTVATAAHCLAHTTARLIKVHAGAKTRSTSEGVMKTVSAIFYNKAWTSSRMDQDAGLVRLTSPFDFGNTIQPIPLAKSGETLRDGSLAMVAGWGYTSNNGDDSEILRYATVPIVNQAACNRLMASKITDYMLCAGYLMGGVDACQKDSGGPLVSNGKLIGIVSWGVGCALPDKPGVYARVSALRTWFDNTLWDNYKETL
ncbi:trypsin 3A1 [Teleopsis dalmanni]|uniref:trypsin 3A1 n=1 Tax=Teleopsis dalmanni TaxID=139649 RepID=UPI0018CE7C70|nr:trypsin 3A1 [Teleopsis dalmanni]